MVIFISGYGTIELAVKTIKNGAYDFIPKPFKLEELEAIIHRALEQYTLIRQLGIFRGLTLALITSIPFWLFLGIILTLVKR
jgi:DNA-binding response OmpR family regulator